MSGDHNMYGDGTVYRGERSADSCAAIQRYKIGYHADEWGQRSSTPGGIPDASGSWVRYADHVIALAAGQATAAPAQPVAEPAKQAVTHLEYKQFLSDVMTAAGLVTHGKRCKALGDRLADMTMRLRASHGQAPADLSPTAGMNIAQRILHVGGRNNDAGYVEFGSIQAVEALVRQVLRDLPAPAPADSVQEDAARLDFLMR